MSLNRELEGDLKEFQSLVKNFFHMNYIEKCNKLKEKEALLVKTQQELKLSKENELSVTCHSNKLQENLNQFRDILVQSTLLEGEINKLQKQKKDLETALETERGLKNAEKISWKNEKLDLSEKFGKEIESLKKKHLDEGNYMKDSLTMEIRELERKISNLEDELAFTRLNNDEVSKQSKKVYDEKLRKKDNEISALKEELNYWRQRNFFYPSPNKIRDLGQNNNSQAVNNRKQPSNYNFKLPNYSDNNKKTIICFQDLDTQIINRLEQNEGVQDSGHQNGDLKNDINEHSEVDTKLNTSNEKDNNDFPQKLCNINIPKKDINFESDLVEDSLDGNTYTKRMKIIKTHDVPTIDTVLDDFHMTLSNDSNNSPQEIKPKAIIPPMKKKVQFPVIKKKRLLNPNQNFL